MSGFEIRGIQNVSFVDLKTGKKINIENAEAPVLSESKEVNKQDPVSKLDAAFIRAMTDETAGVTADT